MVDAMACQPQPLAAASARLAEALIADIKTRVEYINAQVDLGSSLNEVSKEQAQALLTTVSQLNNIDTNVVAAVSRHLNGNGVWARNQLSA